MKSNFKLHSITKLIFLGKQDKNKNPLKATLDDM